MLSTRLCGVTSPLPSAKGSGAPHNWGRSERLEPLEDGAVGPPCSDGRIDIADGTRLGDRGALGREIDGGVPVRGLDAGMAEPMTDRDEVDTGLKKVDGGGVTEDVGMDSLPIERRRHRRRRADMLPEEVANAEPGQRFGLDPLP